MATVLTAQEKKNIFGIWLRSGLMMGSMNSIKRQSQGYCFTLIPVINDLYKNDEAARIDALKRSNQFINSHACAMGFILGLNYALEKEKAAGGLVTGEVIQNVKTSLQGPLAGIGDSIFFSTIRVIAGGIGITYASQGNILGAIIFVLIYGGSFLLLKYPLIVAGYQVGTSYLKDLFEKGYINSVTKAASMLGLMMLGSMAATLISVKIALVPVIGGAKVNIQGLFDGIMPKLLSLVTLYVVYKMLKAKYSVIKIVFIILAFCVFAAYFKVL